jgi:hypothetical protein
MPKAAKTAAKRRKKSVAAVAATVTATVTAGAVTRVSQEESHIKRQIQKKTHRDIRREIVITQDGHQTIKEHEITNEIQHTYEEEIKKRVERSSEQYVSRCAQIVMQEFEDQRMAEWDRAARQQQMRGLPDVGLYKYLNEPLVQALKLQCKDWEKLRVDLNDVKPEEKGKVATMLNTHVGYYFQLYSKYVQEAKREHETEKKATQEMTNGKFAPECLVLLDTARYNDDYIKTTYKSYYEAKAAFVFADMQGHGIRIDGNAKKDFMRAMGNLPSPDELIRARSFKNPHNYNEKGAHGGYTMYEIESLYPPYEPCIIERLRFIERFNDGDFGLLKSLYVSIYVRYQVVLNRPQNIQCLKFEALDHVEPCGDAGAEWAQVFNGHPTEWTDSNPTGDFHDMPANWSHLHVTLDEQRLTFEMPVWFLSYVFPNNEVKVRRDLLRAATINARKALTTDSKYDPVVRLTADVTIPRQLIFAEEFRWAEHADEKWISEKKKLVSDEEAARHRQSLVNSTEF